MNQNFVVPGTCGTQVNVPIFGKLTLDITNGLYVQARTQQLSFSFSNENATSTSGLSLVYINQQNLPIVEKLENVKDSGNTVTFQANFPYTKNEMNGLTIAVVVQGSGPFTSADAVANATLFGPAVIEIN